ncbi:MAG: YfiR family protein [Candidatus Parcubacteria bacterium]|nr:YfiR family protein [Burkholderiales bacterium]
MLYALRLARVFLLACSTVVLVGAPARAQEEPTALERRVKAAFLYKFTGYVDWPPGTFARADSPVTIGVMGDDVLASEILQLVTGRTIDGRPLAVRRVTLADLAAVHILFVGRADTPRLPQIVKALPPTPTLVVSESADAFKHGSVINFVLVEGRVRFDVSLDAAQRRGIRLSSRLLAVAREIQGAPQ